MSRRLIIFYFQCKGGRHLFSPRTYSLIEPGNGRKKEPDPNGLTLVEMLVAMAITLMMMAAVVNLFANVGASVRNRRATIEMGGQLRMVRLRLHNDLVGATCPTLTWQRPGDDNGYLEIVEGQWSDKNPSGLVDGNTANGELDYATSLVPSSQLVVNPNNVTDGGGLGDYDDILALTVRSEDEPFVGRVRVLNQSTNQFENRTIESTLAEVIWYAVENPADGSLGEPGMRTIYRRVLLIAPWLQGALQTPTGANNSDKLQLFYSTSDISVHVEGGQFVPNTLGDLTKRENRFGHFVDIAADYNGFPHTIMLNAIRATSYDPATPPNASQGLLRPYGLPFDGASAERQGEDVMLSDVLAFDVRVYDPGAPLREDPITGVVLEPADLGWVNAPSTPISFGAYVDLAYADQPPQVQGPPSVSSAGNPRSQFSTLPSAWGNSGLFVASFVKAVYDTWSFHYENDGLDQDNLAGSDQGTNGLDDDNQNGVDDMGERETAPPYDVPLRGIQVKLRVYEPDTRNIRETTVTRNFVP